MLSMRMQSYDPVSLEILWHRLIAICDEMAVTLQHTAFSNVVREARDFACALFDSQGNMLVQASNSTLALLGSTFVSVKNICQRYPPERLVPGDTLVTNDPWLCTGHLLDITLVTPIFTGGRLVAFAVCVAHHLDIGGRAQTPETSEVYEEGLWLPVLRLYRAGEPNHDVFGVIRHNVRSPEKVIGDLHAQVAATTIGATRVRELLAETEIDSLDGLGREILARTEQAMRSVIEQIPDGTYRYVTMIDGFDEPLQIAIAITIKGSEMFIDFAGTSPQVKRGINAVMNFTRSSTLIGVRCAANPDVPHNQGAIEPIHITAPEGSVLNATFPSPVVGRHVVGQHLPFAVFGALSQAIPDRVMAASGCPVWILAFDGRDLRGRPFLVVNMLNGGMGARATKDGVATVSYPGNVSPTSIELLESDVPIIVEKKSLIPDSGGPGRFQGGCGQEFVVRVRDEAPYPVRVSIRADRLQYAAPGLLGGLPGSRGSIVLNGTTPLHSKRPAILHPGDVVSWRVPGGGGAGIPRHRDPAAVRADVKKGFVTPEHAKAVYGVIVGPDVTERLGR